MSYLMQTQIDNTPRAQEAILEALAHLNAMYGKGNIRHANLGDGPLKTGRYVYTRHVPISQHCYFIKTGWYRLEVGKCNGYKVTVKAFGRQRTIVVG